MRIGVQRAELEDLPPGDAEILERHPVLGPLVDARLQNVGERVAVEPAHGENAARGELRVDLGDEHLGIVAEHALEERDVLRLVDVVELLVQALLELLVDLALVDVLPHHVAADAA